MQPIQPKLKDGVIEDQELWFFENDIQAFCRMNMKTYEIEIVAPYISNHIFIAMWIFQWKDRLYAVSTTPPWILIFNKNTFELKQAQNTQVTYEGTVRLSNAFQKDNILWLIPCYAKNCLWYFDMDKNQYKKDTCFSNYINKFTEENKMLICRSSLRNQELWSVIYKCPYLLKYDKKRQEIVKFSFSEIPGALDCVLYSGDSIWLTSEKNSNIYRIRNGQVVEITVSGTQSYSNLKETERFIMVLPRFGNDIVMVDKETLKVHNIGLQEKKVETEGSSKILNVLEREHDIILFPNALDSMEILDKTLLQLKSVQVKCNKLYQTIKRLKKFRWENFWVESAENLSEDYLNYILWNQNKYFDNCKTPVIGTEIYKECIK